MIYALHTNYKTTIEIKIKNSFSLFRMKAGKWYMLTFVITFLYFYIYAVNYVRGATIQDDIDTRFSFSQFSQVGKS